MVVFDHGEGGGKHAVQQVCKARQRANSPSFLKDHVAFGIFLFGISRHCHTSQHREPEALPCCCNPAGFIQQQ